MSTHAACQHLADHAQRLASNVHTLQAAALRAEAGSWHHDRMQLQAQVKQLTEQLESIRGEGAQELEDTRAALRSTQKALKAARRDKVSLC